MKNIKTILIIMVAVWIIGLVIKVKIQSAKIEKQKIEIERQKNNYDILQSKVTQIKGENDLYASRLKAQELTTNELKAYYKNLVADISDMKISMRKVAGITAFNTETTNNVNTFFKDSTRINNVPLETLSYKSRWFDVDIIKDGLKANITYVSRDSIIQVVHWDYTGKFWPTRFLTKKEYYQDIKSMNPDSKIKYPTWINPIKR